MRERVVRFLATGLGVGYLPLMPGTFGSLLGLGYWWLLVRTGNVWVHWFGFIVGVAFAIWCAGEAAEAMRRPDPPVVVIDEIAAMPLALAGLDARLWEVALGFALFRLFDVIKPPPVREAEHFTGGLGIVLDDLIAAVYACAGTHAVVWVVERWFSR
jgi:phosphatidylglycerophosphatase A